MSSRSKPLFGTPPPEPRVTYELASTYHSLDFNRMMNNLNELIMIDGGFCMYHKRRDGVLVIYAIVSTRKGAGAKILKRLRKIPGVNAIVATCPSYLESNINWYPKRGFKRVKSKPTTKGYTLDTWRLECPTPIT